MKLNSYLHTTLGAIAAAFALISIPASQAAVVQTISVNTAPLLGLPASGSAPFYLDFQLNGGGSLGNTATLSNFNFGGGSLSAGTEMTIGQASGTLASTITLTADSSNPFNEFYQSFTPGSTLTFDVTYSTNVNVPLADLFIFSILDGSLQNIPTDGFANSLVTVSIDSVMPAAQAFSGTGDFAGVAAAVPEPSRALLLVAGLGVGIFRRRRA